MQVTYPSRLTELGSAEAAAAESLDCSGDSGRPRFPPNLRALCLALMTRPARGCLLDAGARWDKQHLVVETSDEGGSRVIETFGFASDGRGLVVDIRFEGRVSARLRLAYEPAAALHPLHGVSKP